MRYDIKPPELVILKFLSNSDNGSNLIDVRRENAVSIPDIDDVLQKMIGDGTILKTGVDISMTESTKEYLKDYDHVGLTQIMSGNLDLAILQFLYNIGCDIPIKCFQATIINHTPSGGGKGVDDSFRLFNYLLYKSSIKNYLEIKNGSEVQLLDTGRIYYEHLAMEGNKETQRNNLSDEISRLTALSLKFENDISELKRQLNEKQLSLAIAQEDDIPANASDRKTVLHWQIATAFSALVAFLLKLFGAEGWL